MKKILLLIITLLLLGVSGCWDMEDIENKNIVTTVVIDKTDEGYELYLEIATTAATGQGSESQQSPPNNIIIQSKGKTFEEVRKDLERKSNKTIFPGAISCIVFTERMAIDSLEEYIYRMRQDSEFRKTLSIFIFNGEPMELLEVKIKANPLVGLDINETLKSLQQIGQGIEITTLDILEGLCCPNKGFIVPTLSIINDSITVTGYSIFDKGKLLGLIESDEIDGLIALCGEKYRAGHVIIYEGVSYTLDIERTKKKFKVILENNNIVYHISIYFKGEILYSNKQITINQNTIKKINPIINEKIKTIIEEELTRSISTYKVDYLSLYDYFRIQHPVFARNNNWDTLYPTIKYNVDINIKLKNNFQIDYQYGD